jgi:large subunit ribosomal protein L19
MKLIKCINKFEKKFINKVIPNINVGNKIRIGIMIKEGEKERVQFFEGIIIAKNQSSIDTTVTVRKIFQGVGIERTFPIYSPQIKSIKILDFSRAKRAKLFYLRNKLGKAATKIQGR